MNNNELTPEQIAELFHDTYERLAPEYGYETRADTKAFDPESANGKLMIAVCAIAINQLTKQVAGLREDIEGQARIEELEARLNYIGDPKNGMVDLPAVARGEIDV